MTELVVVKPAPSDGRNLILCAANWDGMVASVILTRHLPSVAYQLFCAEDRIADAAAYPAIAKPETATGLTIAALPLAVDQASTVAEGFSASGLTDIRWFSHQFWSLDCAEMLTRAGVQLVQSPNYDYSSTILVEHLGIEDSLSLELEEALRSDNPESGELGDWFFQMLAVQNDHYAIRHALEPLYDGRVEALDPALVDAGRAFYNSLQSDLSSSSLFGADLGNRKMAVLGLPLSYQPHFRLAASLVAKSEKSDLVLVFFDGIDQMILSRQPQSFDFDPDFRLLSQTLGESLSVPIRLFDRNTVLIGPVRDHGKVVDELTRNLKSNL